MIALIIGETELSFPNTASATPHMRAGKIRGLAVTAAQPSALAPGLPTAAASGLPGYESKAMLGIFAPAKTPEMIIDQLNREIVRILNSEDVKKKFFDSGAEVAASSPAELAQAMKQDMTISGRLSGMPRSRLSRHPSWPASSRWQRDLPLGLQDRDGLRGRARNAKPREEHERCLVR